jgi:hypothetical protein
MTKLEIIRKVLVDTFGTNPSLRSIDSFGNCKYTTEDGRHCAVGMCLTPEALSTVKEGSTVGRINGYKAIDEFLQEEYRGHDLDFWKSMQYFHDSSLNFTETGLSEFGQSNLTELQYLYK